MDLRDWLDIVWELLVSAATLNHPCWYSAYIDFFVHASIPWLFFVHIPFTTHSPSGMDKVDHDPGSLYDSGFGHERHIAPTFLELLGKKPGLLTWQNGAGAPSGHLCHHTGRAHLRVKPRRGEQIQEEQSQIPDYVVDWICGPNHAGHIFSFESKWTFSAWAVWTGFLPPEVSKSLAKHST